jgi:hypothetical protein
MMVTFLLSHRHSSSISSGEKLYEERERERERERGTSKENRKGSFTPQNEFHLHLCEKEALEVEIAGKKPLLLYILL